MAWCRADSLHALSTHFKGCVSHGLSRGSCRCARRAIALSLGAINASGDAQIRYHTNRQVRSAALLALFKHLTRKRRYVSSVLLSGLVPDSVYRVKCSVNNNTISKTLRFRTSPRFTNVSNEQGNVLCSEHSAPHFHVRVAYTPYKELVRFGGGGDLGAHPHVRLIAREIARNSPLFVYLGGDIAYAEANANCYQRWDRVLDILTSELVTPDGLTIQWIVAIGNHDAGGYYRMASSIPFFPHYFPYVELGTNGFLESFTPEAEYEISLRRHMYHAHYVPGALGIFVGDSNHVSPTSIQARTFQRVRPLARSCCTVFFFG